MDPGEARTRALADILAAEDTPCPNCGYNLRGLTGDRCPECNQRLEIAVRLAEDRLCMLIFTIITLCIGSAPLLCLLMIAVIAFSSSRGRMTGSELWWIVLIPGIFGPLLGVGAGFLASARGRRWFRRLPDGQADALSIASALTVILLAVAYFSKMIHEIG